MARLINYNEQNFNNCILGNRPLPAVYAERVSALAITYGYNPAARDQLQQLAASEKLREREFLVDNALGYIDEIQIVVRSLAV